MFWGRCSHLSCSLLPPEAGRVWMLIDNLELNLLGIILSQRDFSFVKFTALPSAVYTRWLFNEFGSFPSIWAVMKGYAPLVLRPRL